MHKFTLERSEANREKQLAQIPGVELASIFGRTTDNIQRIRSKFALVDELKEKKMEIISHDILRSQVTLLMSSLDFYLHEVVKYALLKMFKNEIQKTPQYKNFQISMECCEQAINNPESIEWFEEYIILKNAQYTYMSIPKIKDALKIISEDTIYANAVKKLGMEQELPNKIAEYNNKKIVA